ncbi:MAG: hypothetical protein QM817_27150 [Archangium sp.]
MRFSLAVVLLVVATGCVDNKKKMREAQAKRDAEKLANEKAKEQKIKDSAPKVNRAQLGPEWDSPDFLKIALGRPAPEGFWSIFPALPEKRPTKSRATKPNAPSSRRR